MDQLDQLLVDFGAIREVWWFSDKLAPVRNTRSRGGDGCTPLTVPVTGLRELVGRST